MDLIGLFIQVLLICVIGGLFYWAIGAMGTPDPIGKIGRVVVVLLSSLVLIYLLFGHLGHGVQPHLLR